MELLLQLLQSLILLLLAPALLGWINQWRAWFNNKTGAGILQPYRILRKLFHKEVILAENASYLFKIVPVIYFSCMLLVLNIIPSITTVFYFSRIGDLIVLVGIFALARIFLALGAMDIGTAFGSLGARREMLIAFLAEPALLMVSFGVSILSHSTSLVTMITNITHQSLTIYPSMAFAGVAFLMVLLAENARFPVDNPSSHLELTMVHEAMILEYSGYHLALITWASSLKLLAYLSIGIALFIPWGIAQSLEPSSLIIALSLLVIKLIIAGFVLACLETISAKLRLFRAPEFLGTAFLLAVLGILTHLLLGT